MNRCEVLRVFGKKDVFIVLSVWFYFGKYNLFKKIVFFVVKVSVLLFFMRIGCFFVVAFRIVLRIVLRFCLELRWFFLCKCLF